MDTWMYCQACRLWCLLNVTKTLDPVTGTSQVHRCGQCDRIVGAIRFDSAEFAGLGVPK